MIILLNEWAFGQQVDGNLVCRCIARQRLVIGPLTEGTVDAMGQSLSATSAHLRALFAVAIFFLGMMSSEANQRLQQLAQSVGVSVLSHGTSEGELRKRLATRLPYQKMSSGARQRAKFIVDNTSQFRKMPSLRYQVDPAMYQYLISHPDVAVATWRAMGISKLQMNQKAAFEYEASAPDGSAGRADVLWQDESQCIFVVKGEYHSPLIPASIKASALVWLEYQFISTPDGQTLVDQQVQTYIHFPSSAIDVIAKLASRVTNNILDRNVFEVSLYARMMSQATERDPEWVRQLASRMDGVAPQRKRELAEVACSGKAMPVIPNGLSPSNASSASRLATSGEYKDFEDSLRQLNRHMPLDPRSAQLEADRTRMTSSRGVSTMQLRAQNNDARVARPANNKETQTAGTRSMQFFSGNSAQSTARQTHRQLRSGNSLSETPAPAEHRTYIFNVEPGDPYANRKASDSAGRDAVRSGTTGAAR